MKEWKYRFKRGLASFLTVGMIASGVSGTACLPVYAVEASSVNQEDVNDGVRQITEGLRKKISNMVNGTGTKTTANFKVEVNLKQSDNKDINDELEKNIAGKVNEILKELLETAPSELFWYDTSGTVDKNNDLPYSCEWGERKPGQSTYKTDCTFRLAVKEEYRVDKEKSTSIDVDKVRARKAALDNSSELEKVSAGVYDKVKEKIMDLYKSETQQAKQDKAEFTVSFPVKNEEEYKILKEMIEERAKNFVPDLLSECSAELFWYDASAIVDTEKKTSYKPGVWPYDDKSNEVNFTFKLAVKPEYRVKENPEDPEAVISLNVQKIQNDKQLFDDALNLEEDAERIDYSILVKYKNAIAGQTPNVGHLEGSNQFQYLCNKTTEFKSKTECHTIRGKKIKGDTEENDYTWNVVGIESKKDSTARMNYYLVDIAECAQGNSAEYFLVGAQGSQNKYTTANGTTYIPDGTNELFTIAGLKYKQDQEGFRFVFPEDASDDGLISRVFGENNNIIQLKVDGNVYSNISFSSTVPGVATITPVEGVENQAIIHILQPGLTTIWASAYETDSHAYRNLHFVLSVHKGNSGNTEGNPSGGSSGGNIGGNTGGSGTGGNTGGSGTGGNISGGNTGGSGGSGRIGSVAVGEDSASKGLLPQTDFGINSGSSIILKSVGDEDFTITASGEVKDSKITYSSSDPSVATVDVNTGTVHIVGPGTVTISATASQTDLHRAEKCEYKVEVS